MAKKKGIEQVFSKDFWNSEKIFENLPFILFIGFLAIIYIANAHFAERNVRRIQVLKKEIQELRWHYRSLQAEIMVDSKRTEIGEKVKEEGLRAFQVKPKKIVVKD